MNKPPSIRALATRAVMLLVGFYALTIGLAAVLFAVPAIVIGIFAYTGKGFEQSGNALAMLVFMTWVPAAFIVRGLWRVRRPHFEPPGGQLVKKQAPAFFDMVEELAQAAGTAPPCEVYMSPLPVLGVTEVGGTFGYGGKRVLLLGVPILHVLQARELRAALAHEMGHYLGGETKLCGVLSYCEHSFRSVQESMSKKSNVDPGHFTLVAGNEVSHSMGNFFIGGYARFYLRKMRPAAQQQELAADALAVRLCGREPLARALETLSIFGPMYEAYLATDVRRTLVYDVIPEDLVEGFHQLRAHLRAVGTEASITEEVRTAKTDPWDHHPSLTDRVAAMNAIEDGPASADDRPALALFEDRAALDAELVFGTSKLFTKKKKGDPPRAVPWAKITTEVVAADVLSDATRAAHAIGGRYPQAKTMTQVFIAAVREMAAHGVAPIAHHLHPTLKNHTLSEQAHAGNRLVVLAMVPLFQGALVESGAEIRAPFMTGGFTIHWNGALVVAADAICDALNHAQGLAQLVWWANELEARTSVVPSIPAASA